MRSNVEPLLEFSTSSTVRLMSANTPMPDRIIHRAATMTTPAMPTATDSRNDSFITDQGSTRETLSLTRRGAAERAASCLDMSPAASAVRGEPSARREVLLWPAVVTRYLPRCRPHPAPTQRYPPWGRFRVGHRSRLGKRRLSSGPDVAPMT